MWISRRDWEEINDTVVELKFALEQRQKTIDEWSRICKEQKLKIEEYEDDSGEALIHRLTKLAKAAKIDVHSEEYQTMMSRVFLDVGGRDSKVLKAYSGTAFMKDNPEEILTRLKKFQKQASIITAELEDKSK